MLTSPEVCSSLTQHRLEAGIAAVALWELQFVAAVGFNVAQTVTSRGKHTF